MKKNPKQERSRNLISSIFEAASRILVTLGYEKSTTNQIAKKAGVSIGSLYQYFPNKEAIFSKLIEENLNKHKELFIEELNSCKNFTFAKASEYIMHKSVDYYFENQNVLKNLFTKIPHLKKHQDALKINAFIIEELKKYLLTYHIDEIDIDDIDNKLFIVVNAVMGIYNQLIASESQLISKEALKKHFTFLVIKLLIK